MAFYRRRPRPDAEKCADPAKARASALETLAGQEVSANMLYERLCRRYTEQAAAAAVAEMVQLDYVNDARYAEARAHSLLAARKSRRAAAQSLRLKGLHGHDADIVGPGLDGLAYAGDGARAAHADGDGVHETAALPGDGLHDGGAGHPAMVFGVIVIGKPVHIVPALFGGGGLCQRPGPCKAPLGGGMQLSLIHISEPTRRS